MFEKCWGENFWRPECRELFDLERLDFLVSESDRISEIPLRVLPPQLAFPSLLWLVRALFFVELKNDFFKCSKILFLLWNFEGGGTVLGVAKNFKKQRIRGKMTVGRAKPVECHWCVGTPVFGLLDHLCYKLNLTHACNLAMVILAMLPLPLSVTAEKEDQKDHDQSCRTFETKNVMRYSLLACWSHCNVSRHVCLKQNVWLQLPGT